jgi:hypothetical protein
MCVARTLQSGSCKISNHTKFHENENVENVVTKPPDLLELYFKLVKAHIFRLKSLRDHQVSISRIKQRKVTHNFKWKVV